MLNKKTQNFSFPFKTNSQKCTNGWNDRKQSKNKRKKKKIVKLRKWEKTLNTHETNIGNENFSNKVRNKRFCSFNKREINYHFHVVTDFLLSFFAFLFFLFFFTVQTICFIRTHRSKVKRGKVSRREISVEYIFEHEIILCSYFFCTFFLRNEIYTILKSKLWYSLKCSLVLSLTLSLFKWKK